MKVQNQLSKFIFSEEYKSSDGIRKVVVVLEIDYFNDRYKFLNANESDKFTFKSNYHSSPKWLAVLDCMKEAIIFAEKELKSQSNDEKVQQC